MRLLIVEDDEFIGDGLLRGLRQENLAADWVQSSKFAISALKTTNYSILLLDLGLPDKDGLSLLKELRRANNSIPVIIITARDDVSSRVGGLNEGADDYLVKPFALEELIARVHAVMRRKVGRSQPILAVGELKLDSAHHLVWFRDEPLSLSAKEFALLHELMQEPGKVISKETLEESLYGWDQEIGSNAIEVHIHHLRKKIDTKIVKTIRGVGYRIGDVH
ncbi:response regulator [Marinomonas spartinae]|uniref:response regulator n=1 Tax=Marinomonas spartinae TaxID=1792290 RepID=UPI0018F1AABD|nr:response regulator [Marinomonas spartinae]MBJ7556000.1 response regulator [Marinomonas spartinae]